MPSSDAIRNGNAGNGVPDEKKSGFLKKLQRPEWALVVLAGMMLGGALSPMVGLAAATISIGIAGGVAGERLVSSIQHSLENAKAVRSARKARALANPEAMSVEMNIREEQPVKQQPKQEANLTPGKNAEIPEAGFQGLVVDSSGNLLFNGMNVLEQGLNAATARSEEVKFNAPGSSVTNPEDEILKLKSPIATAIRPGGRAQTKNTKGNDRDIRQNPWRRSNN